jgi:hypothetical protein
MKISPRFVATLLAVAIVPAAHAQSISIGLRGTGSFPTGSFSEQQTSANATVIEGAKSGFGYGLDVGLGLGMFGIYAGFDHIKFDCATATCQTDGKYTLQGVTAGVKLSPANSSLFRPFVKGGVTFNDLQGGYGGSSTNVLTTDKAPGYEIGAGLDVSFAGVLSLTPQVRYIGQNLKTKVPGVNSPSATSTGVNYYTFDLGFSVHTPFSGGR